MSDLFDAENLPESRDSSETRDPNGFIDEEKHSTTVLKVFEEFDEEFIPAEFDIFMIKREKENRVGDLESGCEKIGNLDDPKVLARRTLDLFPTKRIHMRLDNFYNLAVYSESFRILG